MIVYQARHSFSLRTETRSFIACTRYFPIPISSLGFVPNVILFGVLYKHYVIGGDTKSLKDLLNSFDPYTRACDIVDIETFKYSKYLTRIEEYFGSINIYICVFEDLIFEPETYLQGILEFTKTGFIKDIKANKINVGLQDNTLHIHRIFNRVFTTRRKEVGLIPASVFLQSFFRKASQAIPISSRSTEKKLLEPLVDFYREDNHLIDERYKLGIALHDKKREKYFY